MWELILHATVCLGVTHILRNQLGGGRAFSNDLNNNYHTKVIFLYPMPKIDYGGEGGGLKSDEK